MDIWYSLLGAIPIALSVYYLYRTMNAVPGCIFCDIIHGNGKRDLQLAMNDKCVVIKDHKPQVPHHYLVLSHAHINRPTDLTFADIPLIREMEKTGREVLRLDLKAKGEADTVEDMLRIGFHWPPMIRVNHLHMHILYPVKDLGFFSKMLIFKPGKVFRETSRVIQELEEKAGLQKGESSNPAKEDEFETLPAHAIAN
ncbi:unnamed protein product, partial [Mesorhabditis belari]|uniref:Adenosine 5'-monophosphoramidase HINT3 n=1 Tax=Mesorhabditis belari TaxID=2138241 RepID=A0AAF3F150_9BILA